MPLFLPPVATVTSYSILCLYNICILIQKNQAHHYSIISYISLVFAVYIVMRILLLSKTSLSLYHVIFVSRCLCVVSIFYSFTSILICTYCCHCAAVTTEFRRWGSIKVCLILLMRIKQHKMSANTNTVKTVLKKSTGVSVQLLSTTEYCSWNLWKLFLMHFSSVWHKLQPCRWRWCNRTSNAVKSKEEEIASEEQHDGIWESSGGALPPCHLERNI